jgi:hypothetical protein
LLWKESFGASTGGGFIFVEEEGATAASAGGGGVGEFFAEAAAAVGGACNGFRGQLAMDDKGATRQASVELLGWLSGITQTNVDGDGDEDVFALRNRPYAVFLRSLKYLINPGSFCRPSTLST